MNRILVKLSGESLSRDISTLDNYEELAYIEQDGLLPQISGFGIANKKMVLKLALDLKCAVEQNISLAVVIGGGNLCRGTRDSVNHGLRASTDKIGMLATVINGIVLNAALSVVGVHSIVLSTRSMPAVCELYSAGRAKTCMESGQVVICVGGSGQPFFTTDTAAVIRACELGCDALFKATNVAGIYEADPKTDPDAKFIERISYDDFLMKKIRIMDATAISIARDEQLPIYVMSTYANNAIVRACHGDLIKSAISVPV
ncbi:MAG: uridine monophosphate kinase [Holosporales bacterium]|jgi:uridylate kinase|nr:uridine monophosphate kinase [Holosporales bacterium]